MTDTLLHEAKPFSSEKLCRGQLADLASVPQVSACASLCESILICVVALTVYLTAAGRFDLLTDDEIRYAEAGRQMLVRGDWIVPVYNGEPRFQKPLLIYWLQALSQLVFGSNALAARVPSAIAAAVTLWATWWMARNVWGTTTARWAVLVLGSMVEFMLLARMVLIDMLLVAFLQMAMAAIVAAWCASKERTRCWLYRLAGLALGGATCAKGPLAVLLLSFAILPWCALAWRRRHHDTLSKVASLGQRELESDGWPLPSWKPVPVFSALLLTALLGLPSYVLPHLHTGGQFTWQFLWTENWQRFTSVVNEHPQPWWFYLALLLPLSFPWTGAIPGALYRAWQGQKQVRNWRDIMPLALLGHIVLVFAFFSLSQTKVWTYTFPAFPSLAMLIAHWLVTCQRENPELLRRRLRQALGLGTGVVLLGALAVTEWPDSRLPEEVRVGEFLWAIRIWAWCLVAMLAVCWLISILVNRIGIVLTSLLTGTMCVYLLAVFMVMPAADRMWNEPVRQLAAIWQRYPQAEVITYHVHELGLNFQARRDLVHHWRGEALADLYERLHYPHPVFVLVDPQTLHHLRGLPIYIWSVNNRFVLLANFSPP